MPRSLVFALTLALSMLTFAAPAFACGGLIGPNGAVNLLRTTTFVGYHDGVEHYVTAFQFAGGGGKFGSLTPLPGVPSNVEKGGSWTLQRLIRETQPLKGVALPLAARNAPRNLSASVSRMRRWSVQSPPRMTSVGTPGSGTSDPNWPLPPANWNAVT